MRKSIKTFSLNLDSVPEYDVEWLTVALGLFAFFTLFISTIGFLISCFYFVYSAPLFMIVNALLMVPVFTIVHEASHRSIFRKNRFLNDLFGYIASFIMHGSFYQFVIIHYQHHAWTNVKGKDPDLHCQGKLSLFTVLRWAFTLGFYFVFYQKNKLGKLDLKYWPAIILPYLGLGFIYLAAWEFHFLVPLMLIWTLPMLAGSALTVAIFDYIPHHPHNDSGKFSNARNFLASPWIAWLSVMHVYHIIHHLEPRLAWYRYQEIYWRNRPELVRNGVREIGSADVPIVLPEKIRPYVDRIFFANW